MIFSLVSKGKEYPLKKAEDNRQWAIGKEQGAIGKGQEAMGNKQEVMGKRQYAIIRSKLLIIS
jgi:hypothetical protein